nr:hypothetical protein [Tanacetum cinerariifolium]
QGCALLRQELEENLVTHSPDFQNTSELSNASTNVGNASREPYVVKQDYGSFVDNIIFDLNRAPDSPHLHTISPNQFRCFHCKDVLRDGEAYGIFCKRCTCKSCGKDAHIGYNCPPKVSVISNPEPCNNQTIDELPQTLPSFHPTFHSEAESSFTLDSTPKYVDDSPNEPDNSLSMGDEHLDTISEMESDEFIKSGVENLIPIPSESEGIPEHMCDVPSHNNSPPLDVSKDQALPPDFELVSSEVMEIFIPEVGWIDDDILLTIKDDILHEILLNVNLLIAKFEALNANPTSSSDCKTKSSSTSLNSLLEETNTSDNSLPQFETFCFDVEEISSGSPTTHSDSPFYASFIFDLLINPFPPADRSDFYEFTDELVPFISPPEYDCFLFNVEPNSGDFTKDVVEVISPTKEPQVLNALPTHPTL